MCSSPRHGECIPTSVRFISNQIYEGRLSSHESCAQQDTEFGTGLRWLEARTRDARRNRRKKPNSSSPRCRRCWGPRGSIKGRVGAPRGPRTSWSWRPTTTRSICFARLSTNRDLRDVQVGTVDKFQGREAPVVFFTMTTSSAEDMPRGPEFLFSRNRLNVAVSRARCLAYLVCTEQLLNSRARTIDEMRLIGDVERLRGVRRDAP